MDQIIKELGIPSKNVFETSTNEVYTVVVHICWLKNLIKDKRIDNNKNIVNFPLMIGEAVPIPWKKIFIKVIPKLNAKVLPLPRYKNLEKIDNPLNYKQLMQYISQTNLRNLWKDALRKYGNHLDNKDNTIVNLIDHDQLLSEVILRLYGCIILRIKSDNNGSIREITEIQPNKHVSKSYDSHPNLLPPMFALETDTNFFIVYNDHFDNSLLDCLNFSPALLSSNYGRALFIIFQLLQISKTLTDRGLSLGNLKVENIFMSENIWIQVIPEITNNIQILDTSLINEQKIKPSTGANTYAPSYSKQGVNNKEESSWRRSAVKLEKLCELWVRGRISNLDYLMHLNELAGRKFGDPQAHYVVPWVTDFTSRSGRNWRDLTKSKYRLTKGDKQLELTYEALGRERAGACDAAPSAGAGALSCPAQAPHHVPDALSDITYYVYMARRVSKEVLCRHVRPKWVPGEYPASVQRLYEWSPDEAVPELYTDPALFKTIHEDLPDLGIPAWASCAEELVSRHREALESAHVAENLHHWIDITFGYKLSGAASVRAKNVSLSVVDGHARVRRGCAVQLFPAPHPQRARAALLPPPPPHRLTHRRTIKSSEETSDDGSDEEESEASQHNSRLSVAHMSRTRKKSSSRTRSLSKSKSQDIEPAPRSESKSTSRHPQKTDKDVIKLPKDYNPVFGLNAIENFEQFRVKCFFSHGDQSEDKPLDIKMFAPQKEAADVNVDPDKQGNAFTNHMFLAAYEQNYLKKLNEIESVLKERKNRSFNNRYTTDGAVYKKHVRHNKQNDMVVIGCLIVEIYMHPHVRLLRTKSDSLQDRYDNCRKVLTYNFHLLPQCVSYIAGLLLGVRNPKFNSVDTDIEYDFKKMVVTDKGLPPPTPSQLLQPYLRNFLIPFPKEFDSLYELLLTLHEFEVASKELTALYTYQCDGLQCEKYQPLDNTRMYFQQRIAEGKIKACTAYLDKTLPKLPAIKQFDVIDIFLPHYIELLDNKDTSIMAAWYLFDIVSRTIGPAESRKKLLKYVLNLYEDDDYTIERPDQADELTDCSRFAIKKRKSIKLYHNIFLLQLIVRFGLECFLDNFTQHLVEAVGGYKDICPDVTSPGHTCAHKAVAAKKPRYSDETVKSALSTSDILSPDTSFGSDVPNVVTPNERTSDMSLKHSVIEEKDENSKEEKFKDNDSRSDVEVFHFETESPRQPSRSSRSKSPSESIDSFTNVASDKMPDNVSPVFSPRVPQMPQMPQMPQTPQTSDVRPDDTKPTSPSIAIPQPMFTSYLHFAEDDTSSEEVEKRKSLEKIKRNAEREKIAKMQSEEIQEDDSYKISDMALESMLWLAHRLGPVLTCRYLTKNLLKMLTLCYIGRENMLPDDTEERDESDVVSITNSRIIGDRNAKNVIKAITAIVAVYGEPVVVSQCVTHMSEAVSAAARRLTPALEGALLAAAQLLPRLAHPALYHYHSLMHHVQDGLVSLVVMGLARAAGSARRRFPSGRAARSALARKTLDAVYALALRIGPELTRQHLAPTALLTFFLAFDKAAGTTEGWPRSDTESATLYKKEGGAGSEEEGEGGGGEGEVEGEGEGAGQFVELCRDGSETEWIVQGRTIRRTAPALPPCSPPDTRPRPPGAAAEGVEELRSVFDASLAAAAYWPFSRLVGDGALRACLAGVRALPPPPHPHAHGSGEGRSAGADTGAQGSSSADCVPRAPLDHIQKVEAEIPLSSSFGSSTALVGNRVPVCESPSEELAPPFAEPGAPDPDCSVHSSRHIKGDWLIYWEHEVGRADKERRFNLKQMRLQTFVGHAAAVRHIHALDNENSFLTASRDRTVKLWSLRNQGEGSAVCACKWTYTGHRKGVLGVCALEPHHLVASTDSTLHLWDPFAEATVAQCEWLKVGVSLVAGAGGGSPLLVCACTDAALRLVDTRTARLALELKVTGLGNSVIRGVCLGGGGAWLTVGLGSGHLATLDTRTGLQLRQWRAHDAEVLQVVAAGEHGVVSSSLDHTLAVSSVLDGKLLYHLKGVMEPAHCLATYYGELITGTTNNRVGVHTALRPDAAYSSTRLRADVFRPLLTALRPLPLNNLLLLGADTGAVVLLA